MKVVLIPILIITGWIRWFPTNFCWFQIGSSANDARYPAAQIQSGRQQNSQAKVNKSLLQTTSHPVDVDIIDGERDRNKLASMYWYQYCHGSTAYLFILPLWNGKTYPFSFSLSLAVANAREIVNANNARSCRPCAKSLLGSLGWRFKSIKKGQKKDLWSLFF